MRDPDHNDREFAASLGITRYVFQNWRQHNGIKFYDADKIAIKTGHHPSYFWGDDYWDFPKMHTHVIESNDTTENQ